MRVNLKIVIVLLVFAFSPFYALGVTQDNDRTARFPIKERWSIDIFSTKPVVYNKSESASNWNILEYVPLEVGRFDYSLKLLPKLTIGTTASTFLDISEIDRDYIESIFPLRVGWNLWNRCLLKGNTALNLFCETSLLSHLRYGSIKYFDTSIRFVFNPLRFLPLNTQVGFRYSKYKYTYWHDNSVTNFYFAIGGGLGYHHFGNVLPKSIYISSLSYMDTNGDRVLGPGEEGNVIIEIANGASNTIKPEVSVSAETMYGVEKNAIQGFQIDIPKEIPLVTKNGKQIIVAKVKAPESGSIESLKLIVYAKDDQGNNDSQDIIIPVGLNSVSSATSGSGTETQVHNTDAMIGRRAGKLAAEANISKAKWFAAGCCFTWMGMAAVYIYEPNTPSDQLLGKSSEYVIAYTDAYKTTAKALQRNSALNGCITGCIADVVVGILATIAIAANQ